MEEKKKERKKNTSRVSYSGSTSRFYSGGLLSETAERDFIRYSYAQVCRIEQVCLSINPMFTLSFPDFLAEICRLFAKHHSLTQTLKSAQTI